MNRRPLRPRVRHACALALTLGWSAVGIGCSPAETQVARPVAPAPAAPPPAEATPAPARAAAAKPYGIEDWWPNQLDLRPLKLDAPKGDPTDPTFDYAAAFSKLDLEAVKKDVKQTLTTSQEWWPADYGAYVGLMIRLAWHSAGTYRVTDGRGGAGSGTIRFAPLNSWPDNANLDKARRLLWPVKKKYGRSLSWADLMVLAGNVSLETAGFKTFGFAGGRVDVFEPTDIDWGPETEWLASDRMTADGKLKGPLGATQMGLIYVNPEGPGGVPDPKAAAHHIREAFGRMAMNDEETVALIAGGHTLGKAHGARKPAECVGVEPEAAGTEEQGLGWKNKCGTGKGADTITSGLEGAWTSTPVMWSQGFFKNLFENEWELVKGPGGAHQWQPKGGADKENVPDAHVAGKFHRPMMLTTDLALREDPAYRQISERFYKNPKEFEAAFGRAWFKLTHRDMGPRARLLGPAVPPAQLWQDPLPAVDHKLVVAADVANLKKQIRASGLTTDQLVELAWASASTYRDTDMRGGANGARIRLAPQNAWAINVPAGHAKTLAKLEEIKAAFDKGGGGKKISLADLIVLGGNVAVEDAAKKAGVTIELPFSPGRTDATQEMTDVASFQNLAPEADAFRNYLKPGASRAPAELLVDKAGLLSLSAPEMTVLLAGLRVLDANFDGSKHGVFTTRPGTLSTDFFVNLLDMNLDWKKSASGVYEARDRKSGAVKWTGTEVDLVFGANSQLRALAEVYAADDAKEKFVKDFAAAWTKVMNLDRFDLPTGKR